jgi:hypothetical protein
MPDDFDSVVADRFTVLDGVPVPDTWSWVQFKVLDHSPVQFTEAEATMIDLETPSPTDGRQKRSKRVLVAGLLAAAAVVAIALVVSRDANDATPADQPLPTVTVPPMLPSRALPNPAPRPGETNWLVPGTYFVDEVSGIPTPRIFATLGTGWVDGSTEKGWHIAKREAGPDWNRTTFDEYVQRDIGFMDFSHPVAVYADACHWDDGNHPGAVDTVDGLVAALSEQQGWAEVTEPSDISVDGYPGKAFQRTAPADMSDCTTRDYATRVSNGPGTYPDFRSWENYNGEIGAGFYYEPGQIETLWVLDIDGTVVVISTGVWPEPSAGAPADFAADVLDSIRIERADEAD